jgi:hypothetical protein
MKRFMAMRTVVAMWTVMALWTAMGCVADVETVDGDSLEETPDPGEQAERDPLPPGVNFWINRVFCKKSEHGPVCVRKCEAKDIP